MTTEAGTVALTAAQQKFILHWSEVGTRWGINRTVAKVHALLYISPQPLSADDLTSMLEVSRSNVSNSVKELLGWGLIRVIHKLGSRQDLFEAVQNTWELCLRVIDERKRREIDPAVEVLRACLDEAQKDGKGDSATRTRLQDLLQFCEMMDGWYKQIRGMPKKSMVRLIRLGSGLGLRIRCLTRRRRHQEDGGDDECQAGDRERDPAGGSRNARVRVLSHECRPFGCRDRCLDDRPDGLEARSLGNSRGRVNREGSLGSTYETAAARDPRRQA